MFVSKLVGSIVLRIGVGHNVYPDTNLCHKLVSGFTN